MDRQFSSSSCSIDVVFSSVSSVRDLSSGGGGGRGEGRNRPTEKVHRQIDHYFQIYTD